MAYLYRQIQMKSEKNLGNSISLCILGLFHTPKPKILTIKNFGFESSKKLSPIPLFPYANFEKNL